jgi:hypothetical protein
VKEGSTKSARNIEDSRAEMGMACTRVVERVCASTGMLSEAPVRFEPSLDVSGGGVLWGLPSLLAHGLLRRVSSCFQLPPGFYGLVQIFILLGFMALARVRSPERLRYCSPGEWGTLMGLDRIPEVRTLREKVALLAQPQAVADWGSGLSQDWMAADVERVGVLYVDGHARPYYGSQTALPRHYMSRERLCLRGTMDYWVNDQRGRPFFVISTPFSDGLLARLREDIVPRLLREVPNQPSEEALADDPYRCRFTLVFDREGYSPDFFKQMWALRIASQTYHKYPKGDWALHEFQSYELRLPGGETVQMMLAERGTRLSNGFWVREVRKLTSTGHQISVLTVDYRAPITAVAVNMFARWSQENYFKYMMQEFGIDRLIDYGTVEPDETKTVVSPVYRKLEGEIKRIAALLSRKRAQFAATALQTLPGSPDPAPIQGYQAVPAALVEEIERLEYELAEQKEKRKHTPKHIAFKDLPETEKFRVLAPTRKRFMDTIKMIAYRAETAMADPLREHLSHPDEARVLLKEVFTADADLLPDKEARTLTVSLHHLANPMSDRALAALAVELNETNTIYPGTDLRLVFKLVSGQNP